MARSPYWPNSTYLDIYIVLTFLITGCNASTTSEEMAGIIAGSILACVLFLVGIGGIVYCIVRSRKSREAKKQKSIKVSANLDYRTVVVRGMPGRGHPTIVGYSDFMLNYPPTLRGDMPPKMQMMSHMATIGHVQRPIQRPQLLPMPYSTARPIKGYRMSRESYIEDQPPKRKSKSKGDDSVYNTLPRQELASLKRDPMTELNGRESQFILRKKGDSSVKQNPIADTRRNEPYALTSLFSKEPEPSPKLGLELPHPKGDESPPIQSPYRDDPGNFPFTHSNPIVYPKRETDGTTFKRYSGAPIPPPRVDDGAPDRPVTPEYDVGSLSGNNPAGQHEPIPMANRFSTPFAEELKQRFQSRMSSYPVEDSRNYPYGSPARQGQFNAMSSAAATSSIRTRSMVPGSYGRVPVAPPLPPT